MARKPTSDEVGLAFLEQLGRASGKKRMRELIEPTPAENAEKPKDDDELNLDDLEALLPQEG